MHAMIRKTNDARETWVACTCGWETKHSHTGDSRWVGSVVLRDFESHLSPRTGVVSLRLSTTRDYAVRVCDCHDRAEAWRPNGNGGWSWMPLTKAQTERVVWDTIV